MRLRWADEAQRDLKSIRAYIARDNPVAARGWVKKLRERARKAARSPLAGRVVPEADREDIREVFVRSYRIVYQVGEKTVEVLTVLEGHKLLSEEIIEGAPKGS